MGQELDYRLIKELWAFTDNRIAVRFAFEWHDTAGNWFRSYGNENWERVTEIRSYVAIGLTATADIFAKRFELEMKAGRLTRTPSAKARGRALVDLMQGLQLRAKAGIAREQLLQDARSYVPLVLGK